MKITFDNTNPCTFQTALRLPEDMRQAIDSLAGKRGLSAFIRQAIAEKIERETGEKIAA
jgi:hypothetical protein